MNSDWIRIKVGFWIQIRILVAKMSSNKKSFAELDVLFGVLEASPSFSIL
jgi:hypothetical protein